MRYGTCAIACDSYGQPVRQVPERAVAEKKHLCGDIAMYVTALKNCWQLRHKGSHSPKITKLALSFSQTQHPESPRASRIP